MRRTRVWLLICGAVLLGILGAASHLPAACTNTTNLGLCKPGHGDADWDTSINSNSDKIDAAIGAIPASNYASLSAAVSAIGSAERTLIISSTFAAGGSTTVPSTLALLYRGPGLLTVATGQTVTINAPLFAERRQIFSLAGTGIVAFGRGAVNEIYPEWWGAKGDDVTGGGSGTDDAAAIQAALNAAAKIGASLGTTVVFSGKAYRINSGVTLAPTSGAIGVNFRGIAGALATALNYYGSGGTALTLVNNKRFRLDNLRVRNFGSGTTVGVAFTSLTWGSNCGQAQITNLFVSGFTTQVHIGTSANYACSEMQFTNLEMNAGAVGLLIEGLSSVNTTVRGLNAVSMTDAVVRFVGDKTYSGRILTVLGGSISLSSGSFNFDFQTPAFLSIKHLMLEQESSAALLRMGPADPSTMAEVTMASIVQLEDIDEEASSPTRSLLIAPGIYSIKNSRLYGGFQAGGRTGEGTIYDRYELNMEGVANNATPPVSYYSGATSIVLVRDHGGLRQIDNNQAPRDEEEYVLLSGGTKRSLWSYPWSGHPTNDIPTAIADLPSGLKVGTGDPISKLKWNATASVADGGTIAHGLGTTPTACYTIGSVAGNIVTSTFDGTNITVAIKTWSGGSLAAGSTQTIQWLCLK